MKDKLNKYLSIYKLTWKQASDYRFDFIFELVCGFIPVIALVMLWNALFEGRSEVNGFTQSMMITYIISARFINIILLPNFFFDVTSEIQNGSLTTYLSKPLSYLSFWFFRTLGSKSKNLLFILIPMIVLSVYLNINVIGNINTFQLMLFLIALIFAYIIYFQIFMVISLMSFWFYDISSWFYTLMLTIELLAGTIIPVSLFPAFMKNFMYLLPFKYLVDFPVETLIGKLDSNTVISGLAWQVVWVLILLVLLKLLWKVGIRKFEANGG